MSAKIRYWTGKVDTIAGDTAREAFTALYGKVTRTGYTRTGVWMVLEGTTGYVVNRHGDDVATIIVGPVDGRSLVLIDPVPTIDETSSVHMIRHAYRLMSLVEAYQWFANLVTLIDEPGDVFYVRGLLDTVAALALADGVDFSQIWREDRAMVEVSDN